MGHAPIPTPLIDRKTAVEMLRLGVPGWEEFLTLLENAKGRLRFRAGLARAIANLRIENYPLLYENERSIGVALVKALIPEQELPALEAQLNAATPAERGRALTDWGELAGPALDTFDIPDDPTPEVDAAARATLAAIPPEELADVTRSAQLLLGGGLALFYEQLSLLVHGERLTSLVGQAKSGSDDAFVKAVQIDGRVLTAIPYFRERHARARMADETQFLARLWRRQVAPPYRGRIEHKSLFLMFAFLDSVGLLTSLAHRELVDLCDELRVGGKRRIEDEKNMGKRLAEYRRFQKRRQVSTP